MSDLLDPCCNSAVVARRRLNSPSPTLPNHLPTTNRFVTSSMLRFETPGVVLAILGVPHPNLRLVTSTESPWPLGPRQSPGGSIASRRREWPKLETEKT